MTSRIRSVAAIYSAVACLLIFSTQVPAQPTQNWQLSSNACDTEVRPGDSYSNLSEKLACLKRLVMDLQRRIDTIPANEGRLDGIETQIRALAAQIEQLQETTRTRSPSKKSPAG